MDRAAGERIGIFAPPDEWPRSIPATPGNLQMQVLQPVLHYEDSVFCKHSSLNAILMNAKDMRAMKIMR